MPQGTCSIDGCGLPIQSRGWCSTHYMRVIRTGDPGPVNTRRVDSVRAERKFRERLNELGATLLEDQWLGNRVPRKVQCAKGHINWPVPGNVIRGEGICMPCARPPGRKYVPKRSQESISRDSEDRFRERLAELGATLLEDCWLGSHMKHRVVCGNGHECDAVPSWIASRRQGICVTCAGLDPKVSEDWFLARMAELGASPLEPYKTARLPVRSICAAGHECSPTPDSLKSRGGGVCRICSERDPGEAQRKFIEKVLALGGKVLETEWLGSAKPHRIICPNGHYRKVRPSNVAYFGLCKSCSVRYSTVFYVVTNDEQGRVKFGVSSGDGTRRLGNHRRAGYRSTVRLISGFDGSRALESIVAATLRDAGISPIKGREYFDVSALAVILDIVDNYPVTSA